MSGSSGPDMAPKPALPCPVCDGEETVACMEGNILVIKDCPVCIARKKEPAP